MDDSCPNIAMMQTAISEANRYGMDQPRRWLARHGGITCSFEPSAKPLNKEFLAIRGAIEKRVPKIKPSDCW